MSFAFIPPANYRPGQKVNVNGRDMVIVGRSIATERNWVGETADGRRHVLVISSAEPITEIPAQPEGQA